MVSGSMAALDIKTRLLARPWVYRLWQAPFAEQKLAPVYSHNDLRTVRRVLDVGCGPGTNARHFLHTDYVGMDWNASYIAAARKRHRGTFLVADVTHFHAPAGWRFDFILLNSFLHHISDHDSHRILAHLATLLSEDGHIHILDLVIPARASLAKLLARLDRGKFPRTPPHWRDLFTRHYQPLVFEPFTLRAAHVSLWHMVYFKGRAGS